MILHRSFSDVFSIAMYQRIYGLFFLVGGWPTPLKNVKVSWDDEIPNYMENNPFMFQTTKQYKS